MAQVTVYGLDAQLSPIRTSLSDAIHSAVMDALAYPPDKRFHRFIRLDPQDFLFPADRSERYTIIEISLFEGRSVEAKKRLIGGLYTRIQAATGITPQDIEITVYETPRHNWGIRGRPGDEVGLTHRIDV